MMKGLEVKQSYDGPTIYTDNEVCEELVTLVREALEEHEAINICFDVLGRTRHEMLSYELVGKLGHDYVAEISYSKYGCKIRKREESK